jgi:hypothetical protein
VAVLTIKIEVPDDKADEVLTSVTDYLGYDGTNTRQQFLTRNVTQYVKAAYRAARAEAARTQVTAAEAAADAVSITSYKGA